VYRNPSAPVVGAVMTLLFLGFVLLRTPLVDFATLPVEGFALIIGGPLVMWRITMSNRVVATDEGIRLVRAFWFSTRLRWVDIDRFDLKTDGFGSWELQGLVIVKGVGGRRRLPTFNAGFVRRDRDYVATGMADLTARHAREVGVDAPEPPAATAELSD